MEFTRSSILSQKLKEFYWTVTRAIGLGYLHDGSGGKHRNGLLRLLFILSSPLLRGFSATRAFDSLMRQST